jgi:transcriptional regulator
MYNSKPHQEHDLGRLHQHMLHTRLAMLVSHGEQGLLATHLPVLVAADEGEFGTVYGHLARANPNGRTWRKAPKPCWYSRRRRLCQPRLLPEQGRNPKVVPTWNYWRCMPGARWM